MKHSIIISALLCTVSLTLSAQKGIKFFDKKYKLMLEEANTEFEKANYDNAIPLCIGLLDRRDFPKAKILLAESYRHMENWTEAEYWYGQIVHLPDALPVYSLYYGKALQANGKCDLAVEWFEEYSRLVPDDLRGALLAKACDKNELSNPLFFCKGCFEVASFPNNSKHNDWSPIFYEDKLVYASEKYDVENKPYGFRSAWTSKLFAEKVDTLDATHHEYVYEALDGFFFENDIHLLDGFTFSNDEKMMYFTQRNQEMLFSSWEQDMVSKRKILIAEKQDTGWTVVHEFPWNLEDYHLAYPTLSADEKVLYFSSDMPGGFGGMDLYYSKLVDGEWTTPINLGPHVNTEGNEIYPVLHRATNKLYFSSEGLGRYGGGGAYDIYFIDIDEGFRKVTKLPFPMNTKDNEYGLVLNEDKTFGYFVSDRKGGKGRDDIYSVKMHFANVRILVIDDQTRASIKNTKIEHTSANGKFTTDRKGFLAFHMKLEDCKTLTISKEGYKTVKKEICTKGLSHNSKLEIVIELEPENK